MEDSSDTNESDTFNTLKYKRYTSVDVWVNDVWIRAGTTYWVNDEGLLHREDGPAIKQMDGTTCWFQNGKWIKGEF